MSKFITGDWARHKKAADLIRITGLRPDEDGLAYYSLQIVYDSGIKTTRGRTEFDAPVAHVDRHFDRIEDAEEIYLFELLFGVA